MTMMMRRFGVFGLVAALFLITGCNEMSTEDFAQEQPRFLPETYFAGSTRAWGIFEDRFGNLRRRFVVDIEGDWDGSVLTLDERFQYADGETDRRVWRLRKLDEGNYEGTAADVVGPATATLAGNAMNLSYTLAVPIGGRTWNLRFDDWMFLMEDGVLVNRARVSKFGIAVGEVTIFFRKTEAEQAAAPESGVQAAE